MSLNGHEMSVSARLHHPQIPVQRITGENTSMCGRYSLVCIDDLGNRFRVFNPMMGARSRFNISPGMTMPVIVRDTTDRIAMMKWGMPLPRAGETSSSRLLINARAETLAERPAFRSLLKDRRCLVPATGFFEWKKEGSRKIPFYLHVPDNPCFSFAGLYAEQQAPDGTTSEVYTIITTEPNALVETIHERQPAILHREEEAAWLSGEICNPARPGSCLSPFPAEEMAMYPVSPLVNSPAADDERVIRPIHVSGNSTLF